LYDSKHRHSIFVLRSHKTSLMIFTMHMQ